MEPIGIAQPLSKPLKRGLMKPFLSILFALLLACLATGCSSLEVHTDWDQSTDFSQLKTYSWATAVQPDTGNAQIDDDLFDERIRRAVDQDLSAKGYQKLSAGTPDFLVSYKITVKDQTDVDSMPTLGYGGRWAGGGEVFTVHYQMGTLFLDLKSTATGKLIWRGIATDVVEPSKTPEKGDAKIINSVDAVLANFPPGASKNSGK